jgi:CheY-like chemotaxis protein
MYTERRKPISNPGRVLCVDDAVPALALRAHILKTNGYEVTASASALQAAQTFESGKFDLAVLDYEMPGMNGAQLAAQLKAASPDLKIILYTGAVSVAEPELRFIDLMIHKSEGVPVLLAAIETFCAQSAISSRQRHDGQDTAQVIFYWNP